MAVEKSVTPPSFLVVLSGSADTEIVPADGYRKLLRIQVHNDTFDAIVRVLTGHEESGDQGTVGGTVGDIIPCDARSGHAAGGVWETTRTARVVGRGRNGGNPTLHVTVVRG